MRGSTFIYTERKDQSQVLQLKHEPLPTLLCLQQQNKKESNSLARPSPKPERTIFQNNAQK